MAIVTGNIGVPAFERKRQLVVVEIVPVRIYTIVTRQTVAAPTCRVCVGESRINLTMTSIASLQVEIGYIVGMTIGAGKGFSRRGELVTAQ